MVSRLSQTARRRASCIVQVTPLLNALSHVTLIETVYLIFTFTNIPG
jgi:hypothetical protein